MHSPLAAGGLGGVMHLLNAQQTEKVRGILASDILEITVDCSVSGPCFILKNSNGWIYRSSIIQGFVNDFPKTIFLLDNR